MPRIADPTKAKPVRSIVSVWENPNGWMIAIKLRRVRRDEQPFVLNGMISPQFNRSLYKAIDQILPNAAVTCGYGTDEAILQMNVGRDLIAGMLETDRNDHELESKLIEYLKPFEKDFEDIETMIRTYLDENAAYINDWRRVIA